MPALTVIPAPRPWEKLHSETDASYQRFLDFLVWPGSLGAWADAKEIEFGVKAESMIVAASRHGWIDRRRAWQESQVGLKAKDETLRLHEVRTRVKYHANLSKKFLGKAERLIDNYMEHETYDADGNVVGTALVRGVLREASEALAKGIEMERLSYGLPGAITRVEHDLRNQVEVSLNIYQEVLALVGSHICDGCRISVGEQLEAIQGRVDDAQKEILMLGAGE